MTNPQKRKGDQFEREVLDFLRSRFGKLLSRFRRTKAGASMDIGDFEGDDLVAYECRNYREMRVAAAVDDATRHAEVAGVQWPLAILKRTRKPVDQAYAVMPLWAWVEMRKEIEKGR